MMVTVTSYEMLERRAGTEPFKRLHEPPLEWQVTGPLPNLQDSNCANTGTCRIRSSFNWAVVHETAVCDRVKTSRRESGDSLQATNSPWVLTSIQRTAKSD